MSDDKVEGGAGPALAAHSKDASTPGAAPASAAANNGTQRGSASTPGSDTITQLSGEVQKEASQAADSASKAFENTSEQLSMFVRDRPLAALLGAGVVGLVVGVILSRRSNA